MFPPRHAVGGPKAVTFGATESIAHDAGLRRLDVAGRVGGSVLDGRLALRDTVTLAALRPGAAAHRYSV